MMGSIMCGCKGQARMLAFEVDDAKVKELKAKALERNTSDPSLKVPFVSTNDVVTAHFGNVCEARILMMAMNMRGRVGDDIGARDAGNYEAVILLDPETYADPRGVRKSLLSD